MRLATRAAVRPSTLALKVASARPLWRPLVPTTQPNTLFSRRRVKELRGYSQRMAAADAELLLRLADRRIAGVRDWEYGTLLGALAAHEERGGWDALDVGAGNSAFPGYLLASGNVGTMTTLDLEAPFDRPRFGVGDAARQVVHRTGSMLDLPFDDGSFDLVTCISAIEHLDGDRHVDAAPPPYEEYLDRTTTALREMARALRPGGLLYVTTDAYIERLQTTDSWSNRTGDGPIWSAYHFEDIERTFVAAVRRSGLELVGDPDFRETLLVADADRSTYRGRYFTTFAVAARRPVP